MMTTPTRPDPLPMVLVVLTVTTGLVDAVSVLGLGRVFTANMTGNVVFLGFAAAGVPGFSVARALVSLAGFVVGAMLGGHDGDELLGEMAPALARVTLERVAACAVLAGCRPEYFPVVVAAVQAVLEPSFNVGGQAVTTQPRAGADPVSR